MVISKVENKNILGIEPIKSKPTVVQTIKAIAIGAVVGAILGPATKGWALFFAAGTSPNSAKFIRELKDDWKNMSTLKKVGVVAGIVLSAAAIGTMVYFMPPFTLGMYAILAIGGAAVGGAFGAVYIRSGK